MQACAREGCPNTFEPIGSGVTAKRFCSRPCTDATKHSRRRAEGKQAAADARWYAKKGWLTRYRYDLNRRIKAAPQRLEAL